MRGKVYLSTARISSVPGCRPVSPPPAPPRPRSTPRPGCLPGTWRPPSPRRRGARGRPADGDGAALLSRYISIYIYPPVTLADTVHCFPFQKRKCGAGVARLAGVRNPTRLPRLIPSKEVGEGDTEPLEEPPLLEELGEDGCLEPDIKH